MKFTDGNWMMQPGVKAHYAAEVYEAREQGGEVTMLVPTQPIRHRGDTLGGVLLTVRLWSPAPEVVAVSLTHHQGALPHGPNFEVDRQPTKTYADVSDQLVTFLSGRLQAVVDRKSWKIDFLADGKPLTTSPAKGAAWIEVEGEKPHTMSQLSLGVGENVYGLGERFTAFVKNGQVVDIWNRDGGTNSEQAYKNIPFYLTDRGYGVFVNHPGAVSFEVASERSNRVQFSVPGETIEYMVVYGPTPKEILTKYTALTGRPALPPVWSFGLWLSTSFTTDYDEKTVTTFLDGMADRKIPLSVFHYDCFWMRGFHWCDFDWDPNVFPDPPGMLRRLHERGLKVSAWINSYIAQASPLFAEGKANGYLLKRADGSVWQWDMWQPGMAVVDFTNPEASEWFTAKLAHLVDQGVDALKTDFGERIPTDVVYHDGSDPERMHNYYTQLYNKAVFDMLEQKTNEPVLFARSATAGGQKYPVHWGGDCWSDFEAMAESLRGGLSLGLSGFGFWSHDIGGFEGKPPVELYYRWVAFGLLSSHSRLHGSGSYRVPWVYGEEACDVLRFFTRLKLRLMPYLWATAVEAHQTGVPVLRAMLLEFPDDPTSAYLDRQYMLGPSLLVAPVFKVSGEVTYYLPKGRWTHLLTGEQTEGPGWRTETHGPFSLPLYLREGHGLVISGGHDKPEDAFDMPCLALGEPHQIFDKVGQPIQAKLEPIDWSRWTATVSEMKAK